MRDAHQYLDGLAQIHRHRDDSDARALWRQGVATLAVVAGEQVPAPLEGLDLADLEASVSACVERGFLEELDFLSPEAAAVAIFELASALPSGPCKRELGRRTLEALHHGSADTFVALATSLALTSPRGLAGERIRAKVALALQQPYAAKQRADALALALISRTELSREWLVSPASGSLPQRRLAARLLERAAREAARRARIGNDSGVRTFGTVQVKESWDLLLNDRESLVWRHVARARGILAPYRSDFGAEIDREHSPYLGITEWRRCAASLAAGIAVASDALERCKALLEGPLLELDAGVAVAMAYGLPAAADVELEKTEELLELLAGRGGLDVAEALIDLRVERYGEPAFETAAAAVATALGDTPESDDDGLEALRGAVRAELSQPLGKPESLRAAVFSGLDAFGSNDGGLARATDAALAVLESSMTSLEALRESTSVERRQAFVLLRDIDTSLLETSALRDLLTAAERHDGLGRLDDVLDRLSNWLLSRERDPVTSAQVAHTTLRLRRLKTLLHLVDSDSASGDEERQRRLRDRRRATAQLLLTRVRADAISPLRRTVTAALARSLDAVNREGLCELSDLLLVTAANVGDSSDVAVLSEATMIPELRAVYRCSAELMNEEASGSEVRNLANALPAASAPRVEALRSALLELSQALRAMDTARCLEDLLLGEPAPLQRLGHGAMRCAQLAVGARRRLELPWIPPSVGAAIDALTQAVARTLSGSGTQSGVGDSVEAAMACLRQELPGAIATVVAESASRICSLPLQPTTPIFSDEAEPEVDAPLASWLPPARTLGGFYIQRAIGSGAGGSVFVACRSDERQRDDAEVFALKVPEYSGPTATTLSEEEFMQMFRQEAGALLSLPEQKNLARFVTFDVGARPKPILVMEMVPGPNLDVVLHRGLLGSEDAFSVLAGVADGLASMHSVGLAHLDVKPANIILRHRGELRDLELSGTGACTPVLVDFGLAGRSIRPGCASVFYGAPEIWVAEPVEPDGDPRAADVYAFACLAFELLTGEVLFAGDSAVDIVDGHLEHDGVPDALKRLANGRTEPFVEVLSGGLRKRPSQRRTIADLARGLEGLRPSLSSSGWPLEP